MRAESSRLFESCGLREATAVGTMALVESATSGQKALHSASSLPVATSGFWTSPRTQMATSRDGHQFESPPLHQEVRANRRDFPGSEIARHLRSACARKTGLSSRFGALSRLFLGASRPESSSVSGGRDRDAGRGDDSQAYFSRKPRLSRFAEGGSEGHPFAGDGVPLRTGCPTPTEDRALAGWWQRRTCATFTIVVTPSITTISWLQSN